MEPETILPSGSGEAEGHARKWPHPRLLNNQELIRIDIRKTLRFLGYESQVGAPNLQVLRRRRPPKAFVRQARQGPDSCIVSTCRGDIIYIASSFSAFRSQSGAGLLTASHDDAFKQNSN